MKTVVWMGSSKADLLEFPDPVRRYLGYQLHLVQAGEEPDDWKPVKTVGSGVREIRVRDASGAYRMLYLAKFGDRVFVLHCFQKKTQQTPQRDLELAARRYRQIEVDDE